MKYILIFLTVFLLPSLTGCIENGSTGELVQSDLYDTTKTNDTYKTTITHTRVPLIVDKTINVNRDRIIYAGVIKKIQYVNKKNIVLFDDGVAVEFFGMKNFVVAIGSINIITTWNEPCCFPNSVVNVEIIPISAKR